MRRRSVEPYAWIESSGFDVPVMLPGNLLTVELQQAARRLLHSDAGEDDYVQLVNGDRLHPGPAMLEARAALPSVVRRVTDAAGDMIDALRNVSERVGTGSEEQVAERWWKQTRLAWLESNKKPVNAQTLASLWRITDRQVRKDLRHAGYKKSGPYYYPRGELQ